MEETNFRLNKKRKMRLRSRKSRWTSRRVSCSSVWSIAGFKDAVTHDTRTSALYETSMRASVAKILTRNQPLTEESSCSSSHNSRICNRSLGPPITSRLSQLQFSVAATDQLSQLARPLKRSYRSCLNLSSALPNRSKKLCITLSRHGDEVSILASGTMLHMYWLIQTIMKSQRSTALKDNAKDQKA